MLQYNKMTEPKIILDVASILDSSVGSSQSFSVGNKLRNFIPDVRFASSIVGTAVLTLTEENYLAAVFNCRIIIEISCARCLKKFEMPLMLNYEQDYTAKRQDDSFPILVNKTIDIYPSIRQEILLSLPIKPLCNKKCEGIK